MNINIWIEQINGYIEKIREYKESIKNAIIAKGKEIDSTKEIPIGNNLADYSRFINDYLTPEFEGYFTSIGYDSIPEELLLTLQGQAKYMSSNNKNDLNKSLFIEADFIGNLSNNRRCILLFTDRLSNNITATSGGVWFNYLNSLQEVYILNDKNDLTSYKESQVNPYWFCFNTTHLIHIYAYLDVGHIGYYMNKTTEGHDPGVYFFSTGIYTGNVAKTAKVPYLQTLYMKNIHRAYNFGNSPLSMDSVRYCIRNAKRDEDYAVNEKTDEKEGTYKFTLMGSAYTPEQIDEIQQELATKVAEGVNMEILFSGN
jgi:hypothetical protein